LAATYLEDKLSHIRGAFIGRSRGSLEAVQVVTSEHKVSARRDWLQSVQIQSDL